VRTNVRRRSHKRATSSHKLRTDTHGSVGYGRDVSKTVSIALIAVLAMVMLGSVASAGDGPPYRRTTPRGSFGADGPELLVGVPGGRAWGIESALIPVPEERTGFRATLEVSDPLVREAFVRIAWYDRATGRPRQFALTDARFVRAGETAIVEVALDPPPGAVAYRLRVLARLRAPEAFSAPDAVRAIFSSIFPWRTGVPPVRLLP